jgi:hypothetical protein
LVIDELAIVWGCYPQFQAAAWDVKEGIFLGDKLAGRVAQRFDPPPQGFRVGDPGFDLDVSSHLVETMIACWSRVNKESEDKDYFKQYLKNIRKQVEAGCISL